MIQSKFKGASVKMLIFLVLVLLLIFASKFSFKLWKLNKIEIKNLNIFPFYIEVFYPAVKLAIMTAEERFQTIANYSWTNPDIVKFWLGPKLTLLISNPEKMHKTLSSPKCLEKWNIFYKLMERDHGLISGSCKAKWKEHRKLFNSSFSIKMLESFVPTFIEFSEILCEKLHTKVESDEFDFFAFSKRISFDILCTTSLGMKMKGSEKKSNYEEVFEAYET